MTSSAVLSLGTGARGDLEQVANNESHGKALFDDWIGHVRSDGGTTAWVGDGVWGSMYPTSFSSSFEGKGGLSIDAEEDREVFVAGEKMLAQAQRPTFVVAHFLTPDHVGHGHGIGAYYYDYIRGFDGRLEHFLEQVPKDTTVVVLSDHGATDAGTHGSNTEIQRRSPFVAYGPGVVAGPVDLGSIEQIDLPATFATLLGVGAPAHDRGWIVPNLLAISSEAQTKIGCQRLVDLRAVADDVAGGSAAARPPATAEGGEETARTKAAGTRASCSDLTEARAEATAIDQALGKRSGSLGWIAALVASLFPLGAAISLFFAKLRDRFFPLLAGALALVAAAATAAYSLELLPGRGPDQARGVLYFLCNIPLLALLLRPRATLARIELLGAGAALLLPGLLVVTETKTTQPETFAFVAVTAIVAATFSFRSETRDLRAALASTLPALFLAPAGLFGDNFLPRSLTEPPARGRLVAMAAFAAYPILAALLGLGAPPATLGSGAAKRSVGLGVVLPRVAAPVLALLVRDFAAPSAAVGTFYGATIAAIVFAIFPQNRKILGTHTHTPHAITAALTAYATVSRPAEVPYVILSLLAAEALGRTWLAEARRSEDEIAPGSRSALWIAATLLFALPWLQRVAIQEGIHFTHFDFHAGAFREDDVGLGRLIAANLVKHGAPRAVLVGLFLQTAGRFRRPLLEGLVLIEGVRAAVLVLLLYVCRHSFWTPVWVLGDLPHALVGMILPSGLLAGLSVRNALARRSDPSNAPSLPPMELS
jgi:hypothetical protein